MLSIDCSSPVKNGAGRNVVDGDRISKKSEREVYFSLLLRGEKKVLFTVRNGKHFAN